MKRNNTTVPKLKNREFKWHLIDADGKVLGKLSTEIASLLIGKDKVSSGKFIILLGTGLGIIGFIFSIILGIYEGNFTYNSLLTFGAIGIILLI